MSNLLLELNKLQTEREKLLREISVLNEFTDKLELFICNPKTASLFAKSLQNMENAKICLYEKLEKNGLELASRYSQLGQEISGINFCF